MKSLKLTDTKTVARALKFTVVYIITLIAMGLYLILVLLSRINAI